MESQGQPTTTLHCPGCDSAKPAEAFYRCRSRSSGRQSRCIECWKSYQPMRAAQARYGAKKDSRAAKLAFEDAAIKSSLTVARTLRRTDHRLLRLSVPEIQSQAVLEYLKCLRSHRGSRYRFPLDFVRIAYGNVLRRTRDACLIELGWKLQKVRTPENTTRRNWLPPPVQELDHAHAA